MLHQSYHGNVKVMSKFVIMGVWEDKINMYNNTMPYILDFFPGGEASSSSSSSSSLV